MIRSTDAVDLAPGVSLDGGRLHDDARAASWPLNAAGAFILERAGQPLGVTAEALAGAAGLSLEQARTDVLRFVWQLNALALVNIRRTGSRLRRLHEWVVLAARLAPAGSLPAMATRRRAIDTRSPMRGLVTALAAAAPRASVVSVAALALALHVAALARLDRVDVPVAAAVGVGVGIALHEALHAAALAGVPSALVTSGRRTYVLHRSLARGRRALVALAGPAATAALGLSLVAAGSAVATPALVALGWPLAAHALALTAASPDGRAACGL